MAEGNQYVSYYFPKPGESKASEKLSYSAYFPNWNMMIGVGVYIDEIDSQISVLEENIANTKSNLLSSIAVLAAVVTGILLFIALFLIKTITGPIKDVEESVKALSSGNGDLTMRLDTDVVKELVPLSGYVNDLLVWLHGIISEVKSITENVRADAKRMKESAEALAANTVAQHHETDQVASATTEMSQASSEVANNAIDAMETSIGNSEKTKESLSSASDGLSHILSSIEQISSMNEQISTAAEQQSVVSADISQRIVEISDQTDKSKSLASDNEEISINLRNNSKSLDKIVGNFKLE